ncbi:polysaccharide deacetylase family protein [uncultured Flavobacterium sp.]|uniref:polysaccharide deacetylase family protein n=1 Tax=uncultured Flavobacterium sp. TaxID=165435 RepID=UPI0030CA31B9|tara:strand:+ start:284 stop:910 length:627 start_codon:yes stop_codon:yes gene_type:complete
MIKVPRIIKKLFYNQIWEVPNDEKKIYLTFDDGPTPEITEWVLDVLKKENIKATFFCIGNNIEKHPEVFIKTIQEGHAIGNHTFSHLQGWKTSLKKYIENAELCNTEINKQNTGHPKLFRPPYGKITPTQSQLLRKKGYKIIMWDVLSKDYDSLETPKNCLENVIKHTAQGSIIVFHDSKKASQNLKLSLPETIKRLKEKGFIFDVLN